MKKHYISLDENNIDLSLEIDESNGRVELNGKELGLTPQEYSLLCLLAAHCDRPVSRNELLKDAWGYLSPGLTRTVDVHIQRLRKKLGYHSIDTVQRCGYRLMAMPAIG